MAANQKYCRNIVWCVCKKLLFYKPLTAWLPEAVLLRITPSGCMQLCCFVGWGFFVFVWEARKQNNFHQVYSDLSKES